MDITKMLHEREMADDEEMSESDITHTRRTNNIGDSVAIPF